MSAPPATIADLVPPTFATRLGELYAAAVRATEHAPACVERQEAFALAVDAADSIAPLKVCSCDWPARLERKFEEGVVREIGGRFGAEAARALAAEPWYRRRIVELEAQLARVHARALT